MKAYLIIFKRQPGQEKYAYSIVNDPKIVTQMRIDGIVEAVINAPRQEIYSKDQVIELVKNSKIANKISIE